VFGQLKTLMIPISTNRFCDWGIRAFYLLAPNSKNGVLKLLKGNHVSTNLRARGGTQKFPELLKKFI